jgi:hypothetical protein
MLGSWDIKFPQPLAPVRPGDSIRERKQLPKRPRREHDAEHDPQRRKDEDDDQAHIDDYA